MGGSFRLCDWLDGQLARRACVVGAIPISKGFFYV
jgi:hypothetical protein